MEIKSRLGDLLRRAHEEEQVFIAGLTDAERAAVGAPEHWSAKDAIAHVATWNLRLGRTLTDAARISDGPSPVGDVDQANAAIFEEHRTASWAEVIELSNRALDVLLEGVQGIPEDDLSDPQRFSWLKGQPLWRRIVGTAYIHSITHLGLCYVEHGNADYALRLQEAAAELLSPLDDSPTWQGTLIYNIACYHALAGHKETAIAKLGEAFRLNPGLTEWAKQDTDLDSIREEPGYQAFYSS